MDIINEQKIGTYFKRENIFLATVSSTEKNSRIGLTDEEFKEMVEDCEDAGIEYSSFNICDIFYKDGDVYLQFYPECVATYVGDNSDGMGIFRNVVPAWEYFTEEQLYEKCLLDGTMVIRLKDEEPLNRYIYEHVFGCQGSDESR